MPSGERSGKQPLLPGPLIFPLSLLPGTLHSRLLAGMLNKVLAAQLADGELDFLQGRSIAIKVCDTGVDYRITLAGRRLLAGDSRHCDLSIQATVYDFLVLAARREDPDTLVFQRRLVMEGDTELGLQVKNFLDSLDADSLGIYGFLEPVLQTIPPLYKKVFGSLSS